MGPVWQLLLHLAVLRPEVPAGYVKPSHTSSHVFSCEEYNLWFSECKSGNTTTTLKFRKY